MAFTRVRTIKGRQYLYREERWREGKKVRSKSIFLGAVGAVAGFIGANLRVEPGTRAMEKAIEIGEREKERLAVASPINTPIMQTAPVSQPSFETAVHSSESSETASAASPR